MQKYDNGSAVASKQRVSLLLSDAAQIVGVTLMVFGPPVPGASV